MWWRGEPKKIFAYGEPIDMRCSFDGLVAAVKVHLGADPLTGDAYVFVNRRRTLRKGVFWGQTGWCVFAKRPHRGTFEVLREAGTERLVERPGSYVVLRYVRKVVKLKDDGVPSSPPAPPAVIDRSVADVSLIAGLLVDKCTYHLPLYRQHQRLQAAGIKLSRQTLTNNVARGVSLLEPVYYAQHSSVLSSKVLAMDETPIKAGRKSPGKLNQGYYWALYGDKDEVSFEYSPTRAFSVVREILGSFCGVLIADGYGAYDRYAQEEKDVVLAQCWAHTHLSPLRLSPRIDKWQNAPKALRGPPRSTTATIHSTALNRETCAHLLHRGCRWKLLVAAHPGALRENSSSLL